MSRRWVLASGNAGKLKEFRRRLEPFGIELIPQGELGIQGAEETGDTFAENAMLKAEHAARESGLPALADDSGLEVDALDGAPGVRSARYAGPDASDADNVDRLLAELDDHSNRAARFCCVLTWLAHPDFGLPEVFTGHWHGEILRERRGSGGFGYDPVFYVPDQDCTAAELDLDVKNELSHRGQAMDQLIQALVEGRIDDDARL
ncbi:MAG: RdgB/HAM1 family non-canonical purine NTP pyrophosphatase [Xanthomonadales bacterium]|nr:RdgB/HAM1 family non-canonical purine NTP pyrophosphatase [Xanthomonadales bacterium]